MEFIIEHLSKKFGEKEVLRDIDFSFENGKIYGLLGRNGAGKTTLFNCINRDIKFESGSFYIEEKGARREVLHEDIGYVLSTPTVPEFLTGREFLKFFLDINGKNIENPRPLDEYFDYVSIAKEDRDKLLKDFLAFFILASCFAVSQHQTCIEDDLTIFELLLVCPLDVGGHSS